jgi:hypothetical protein
MKKRWKNKKSINRFSKMKYFLLGLMLLVPYFLSAQDSLKVSKSSTYDTKVSAYIGIAHPIVGFTDKKTTWNFDEFYLVGLSTAIIIRKHAKYAYNLELISFVRAQSGKSRTNLMIHPGVSFYLPRNFAITPRVGFETSGRYGPTLVIGKTLIKSKLHPFNFNLVNLFRFGADLPFSYTTAINLTVGF